MILVKALNSLWHSKRFYTTRSILPLSCCRLFLARSALKRMRLANPYAIYAYEICQSYLVDRLKKDHHGDQAKEQEQEQHKADNDDAKCRRLLEHIGHL